MAGKEQRYRSHVNVLLSAALAAEAVLLYFQHTIAQTFCSYCLIIFSLIVIIILCNGVKQLVSGGIIFISVVVAMSVLQFDAGSRISAGDLDRGTMAVLGDTNDGQKHYLFFSADCKYCENVIDFINNNKCSVRFNPIGEIIKLSAQEAVAIEDYSFELNKQFLSGLNILQIPVLVTVNQYGFSVIKGEQAIKRQLLDNCIVNKETEGNSLQFNPVDTLRFLPPAPDDACSIESDCDSPQNVPKPKT